MSERGFERRAFLAPVGATGISGLAGCSSFEVRTATEQRTTGAEQETNTAATSTEGRPELEYDYDGYLSSVSNYDGTTRNMRGQAKVTVQVGAGGNGGSFAFSPPALHIDTGTTVHFEWVEGNDAAHSVRHENGAFDFGAPTDVPGVHFTIVCETDGQYRYYCPPHEALSMMGAIVVGSSQEPVTDPNSVTVEPNTRNESANW